MFFFGKKEKQAMILTIDWEAFWLPSTSLPEILLRGSITYWAIFLLFRLFRRGTGQLTISDVLLITLIADAAQNGMAGDYKSITEGLTLVATLFFWDYAIDYMGYHSLWFRKRMVPKAVMLIRNGKILNRNLEKELLSLEELEGLLRENGVDDPRKVKACYLESSGNISVVIREKTSGK